MFIPQLSVVLPLFGGHRAVETLPAVCRAWLRQDVPCEVVVAVAEGTPVPDLGDAGHRVRIVSADRGSVSPGPLRNLAAAQARAPVLYLGDGDIVPLGADFARQALEVGRDQPMIQPWMYRLVNPEAAAGLPPFDPPARGRMCHVSVDADGRLAPVGREKFAWTGPGVMTVEAPPGFGWCHEDGTPWPPVPFHWGGILVARETFEAVGRYCTRYVGYGCEDDDLIAKLDGRTGAIRAWRSARGLTCLHYEHPRAPNSAGLSANLPLLEKRLAMGADAMIEEDRS
jgi:hypothetical protein